MDSRPEYVVPISHAHQYPVNKVGGKSRNISFCQKEGFHVPEGFAVTTDSYFAFLEKNRVEEVIDRELVRKKFDEMRWEEIWDSALRIRHAFSKGKFPEHLEADIMAALSQWPDDTLFAVRSSSPDEDSKEFSFAGVHESYINVAGSRQVLEKIKLVWASLWSDRALLYKKEQGLNSATSAMAVLVQKMEHREVSGLAFTADPVTSNREHILVEAIRGSLNLLVDNKKAPERFKINKESGQADVDGKTLTPAAVSHLHKKIMALEEAFGEPIDIEWTGTEDAFTVLQVRPITVFKKDDNEERVWYLTLTPSGQKLIDLAEKVENQLIPALQAEGDLLAGMSPESLTTEELIDALEIRGESYSKWTKVYWDDFIPFANGIRNFGSFYNDLMQPADPYEFVLLLKTQELLAQKRDRRIKELARILKDTPSEKEHLEQLMAGPAIGEALVSQLGASEFSKAFSEFLNEEMDVSYDNVSLKSAPEASLRVILALSDSNGDWGERELTGVNQAELAAAYFKEAMRQDQFDAADQWLRIGRVSWKLRDDDNILLGKVENQLLLFIMECLKRLFDENKIDRLPDTFEITRWREVYKAMTENESLALTVEPLLPVGSPLAGNGVDSLSARGKARQLTGQPSSPGVYTGRARIIRSISDFKEVEKGEVLVFDAVQPQMTFIISLAGAIIERRGGMLVHSSIIAREMNIPAVNGVPKATELIVTGDMVTVNGDMGIIVIGKPEFEVEFR